MRRPVSIDEIRQLSVAERVLLVEEIWDSISADAESWSLSADQQQELTRRAAAHDCSPDEGTSWDEIKAGLRSRP